MKENQEDKRTQELRRRIGDENADGILSAEEVEKGLKEQHAGLTAFLKGQLDIMQVHSIYDYVDVVDETERVSPDKLLKVKIMAAEGLEIVVNQNLETFKQGNPTQQVAVEVSRMTGSQVLEPSAAQMEKFVAFCFDNNDAIRSITRVELPETAEGYDMIRQALVGNVVSTQLFQVLPPSPTPSQPATRTGESPGSII